MSSKSSSTIFSTWIGGYEINKHVTNPNIEDGHEQQPSASSIFFPHIHLIP
jgi:hypothetical protein